VIARLLAAALFATFGVAHAQTQMSDPDFRPAITRPAFASNGPVVALDEAHANFHTASGRYKPFVDLVRADGFTVRESKAKFDATNLRDVKILVIANATAQDGAAFTDAEADAVRDWVRAGGALLLVADHAPFGAAAESLAARFGVGMGKGWVFQRADNAAGMTTQIDYARASGALADHPITRGRSADEIVSLIRAFTGQSLKAPADAVVLMRLGDSAREAPDNTSLNVAARAIADKDELALSQFPSVAGRAQGLAMRFGRGRVVVLGEAGMLSAQVVRFPAGDARPDIRMGMNVAGYDNQKFATNVMRWLAGVLD